MVMARAQTLVQLSDELLGHLDERAARERRSRSALIREALEAYLRDELKAEVDRRIVDGYRRLRAQAGAREASRDERW
jgi:metal-responsive CopG/Arc/MetJ family transcriptional regulator